MCGLWAFFGTGADPQLLRAVALAAARRGPHAWGAVWRAPGAAQVHCCKESRALYDSRFCFDELAGAPWVVGHCRLSTSGTPQQSANNQPLIVGPAVVAHNGNIPNHRAVAAKLGLALKTACDSELVGHLAGDLEQLRTVLGQAPYAVILFYGGRLVALRHRHPLYVSRTDAGFYFGSREWPGAELLGDDVMWMSSQGKG